MQRTSTLPPGLVRLAATCLVVFVAAAVVAVALGGCGVEEIASPTSQIDVAKDTSVKASILAIQTGIQAYIATTQAAPPEATKDVLGGFVQPWPQNPWTKTDMTEGTGLGDFTYTAGPGLDYKLVSHLSGGAEYVKP